MKVPNRSEPTIAADLCVPHSDAAAWGGLLLFVAVLALDLRQQPPVGCSEPPAFRDEDIIVYAIHALDQFS
jgi:hypothetical protein